MQVEITFRGLSEKKYGIMRKFFPNGRPSTRIPVLGVAEAYLMPEFSSKKRQISISDNLEITLGVVDVWYNPS